MLTIAIATHVGDGHIFGYLLLRAVRHQVSVVLKHTVVVVVTRQLQIRPRVCVVLLQHLSAVVGNVRGAAFVVTGRGVLTKRRRHDEYESIGGARQLNDVVRARVRCGVV